MLTERPTSPQTTDSVAAAKSPSVPSAQLGEASDDVEAKADPSKPVDNVQKLSKAKVTVLLASVILCMFLVGLDRTIVSTAIPQITNDFHSLADVGWYGSAYLLTCCAFQLSFGKIYTMFSLKGVYLGSLLLFEVASALCGAAPNSAAFCIGRALAGVGAAGVFAGTIVSIVFTVPLKNRPQVQGLFGAFFGLASVVGPLIGGAFTSNVTWRWCFYLNLPLGGAAAVVIIFSLKIPERETTKLPLTKKLLQLDVLGTSVLVPGVVCLILALQWGGQTYAWSNGRVIALLTLMSVLLVAFVMVQIFFPATATIPPRVFNQRSVIVSLWQTLCIGSGSYIYIYFLPIWFQSITRVSAAQSGVRLLPLLLSTIIGSVAGGFITPKFGYYTPFAIVGSAIMSVGAGLLTTFQVNTGSGKWIGYQVVYGIGMGLCFQVPNLAVQTVLPKDDVPIGLALMLFGQLLGAAVFVAVGENVLASQLVKRLSGVPGFNPSLVTSGGATSLINAMPADQKGRVLIAYNESLRTVFRVGLILSCLTVLGAVLLEWKSILKKAESEEQMPETKPSEASDGAEMNGAAGEGKVEGGTES